MKVWLYVPPAMRRGKRRKKYRRVKRKARPVARWLKVAA